VQRTSTILKNYSGLQLAGIGVAAGSFFILCPGLGSFGLGQFREQITILLSKAMILRQYLAESFDLLIRGFG
jgi:hypothetical protein